MLKKVVAALRSAVVVPLFFFATLGFASAVTIVAVIRPNSPLVEKVIRTWSRLFMISAGVRLEITGKDKIDTEGQYVFLANHLSNLDIPAMFLTAPVPIRYLAKKEVYKIPFVAMAMRKIGIVRVDREGGSAIHSEVNAGVAAAKARGHSLIIFPEGTRSATGELRAFKKGAFRIAIANQLTVVPITIAGTWEAWPPGSKLFWPGRAKTVVHDPISTKGMELRDIDELRAQVRSVIDETYSALREA